MLVNLLWGLVLGCELAGVVGAGNVERKMVGHMEAPYEFVLRRWDSS